MARNAWLAAFVMVALAAFGCAGNRQDGYPRQDDDRSRQEGAGQERPPAGKTPSGQDMPHANGDAGFAGDPDKFFLMMVGLGNTAEIEAGQLAEGRATSEEVRQFARRMIDDHGKANRELADLAKSKGVNLPAKSGEVHAMIAAHLSKLSGRDFDQEYIAIMAADHAKVVSIFETKARMARDADIRAWATKTLPTLQEHLKMAREINEKLGEDAPAK